MCKRVERICQVDPEGWYAPVIGEELVRCKDCKWQSERGTCITWYDSPKVPNDGYCYLAERKEE